METMLLEDKYWVKVVPGDCIKISRKNDDDTNTNPKTFKVGDLVEYDSWNLSYIGKITKITPKTVFVDKNGKHDHIERVEIKRMKLYEFAWRNYDFDLAETSARNAETMMYI